MIASELLQAEFTRWLERWWPPFYRTALIGFCISLGIHIAALTNRLPPWRELAWTMHVGALGVFAVALMQMAAIEKRQKESQPDLSTRHWLIRGAYTYWRTQRPLLGWMLEIWRRCPLWLSATAAMVFFYTLSFWVVCFSRNLLPFGPNAGAATPPIVFAFFSAGWMYFFVISAAIIYTARADARNLQNIPVG